MLVVEDSLSANGPHVKLLKELSFSYSIVVKPDAQAARFEEVQNRVCADQVAEFEELGKDGVGRGYRFTNAIALNKAHPEVLVNDLEYWARRKGKEHNFSWSTDIDLTRAKVYFVMRGGRARCKIENEPFNTLPPQGYQGEHNYGHGEKQLAPVCAMLMMLACLVDQVQPFCCSLFTAARQKLRSRTWLWDKIRGLFTEYFIESWESLWLAIIYKHKGAVLQPDTS